MRIVFMGTPEFAVPSLRILLENNFEIAAVITAPDKAAGRGQQIQESAVKKFAAERGLKILQPEKLKDADFLNELKSLNADLQFVVAFRMLPEAVWNMPELGTFNLHASLLPKFRGAAPINWAIINGEKETGITTFKLQQEIDTGNILLQEKVTIGENMNAGELHDELMVRGAALVLKTAQMIREYSANNIPLPFKSQNENEVSHAPKIFKETCRINWNMPAVKIHDHIRGLSRYPGAFTELITESGKLLLKIFASEKEYSTSEKPNGSLVCDGKTHLKIRCSDGFIVVKDLQLQGRKRMGIEEFLRGSKIAPDAIVS